MRTLTFMCVFAALAVQPAVARSPEREVIPFSITWDVGFGSNVYVVGSHADLGLWSPTSSVKLRWTSGNVWTGQVAVQKGTTLEYKFIARSGATNRYCDAGNVQWEPGPNRTNIIASAPPAPYAGKTVFYYSAWTSVTLITVSGTNVDSAPMQRAGVGRVPDEYLYRADGVGEEGEGLEFVPNGWANGTNYWDNPAYTDWNNNYYTTLDTFLLQDKQIYNYWPTSSVSASRVMTNFVNSTVLSITGRTVWIYLPRGYDSHPSKRYPVLYMHDGTNVFDPGGTYGSWSADATATREISQGRMRECIIAAVNNADNRRVEYEPPGDTYTNEPPGHGDAYLRFLVDNVRPMLDVNYRTLNDRRNTLVGGSSMGGLISIYCVYETNVYGAILAMSPSITRAPNYTAALSGRARLPVRIYMDTGTDEGNVGVGVGNYWDKPWEAYDLFLAQGYAPNEDLLMRIGCGDYHNEPAWRGRLPNALRFLLNVRDEPNLLAQETWPARITNAVVGALAFPSQQHFAYQLQAVTNGSLSAGSWETLSSSASEEKPWNSMTMTNPLPASSSLFLRVRAHSSP